MRIYVVFAIMAVFAVQVFGQKDKLNQIKKKIHEVINKARGDDERGKPDKDSKVGNAAFGLFKKGGGFNMARKGTNMAFKLATIRAMENNSTVKMEYALDDLTFEITKDANDSSYGAAGRLLKMKANFPNNGSITFSLIIFRENGTVETDDGYEYDIVEGTSKFNVDVDWPTDIYAVDVEMKIKCFNALTKKIGKKLRQIRGKAGNRLRAKAAPLALSLCPNARLTFPKGYFKRKLGINGTGNGNSTWTDMQGDYPRTEMASGVGWSKVTLRFEGARASYDPLMEIGSDVEVELDDADESTGDDTNDGVRLTSVTFILIYVLGNIMKYVL